MAQEATNNIMERRAIPDLLGKKYYIPEYQRGYRWEEKQVMDLLDDLNSYFNGYIKGPIMFSWDDPSQLQSLMSTGKIQCQGLSNNPFLIKIAITNFPAEVNECVKDINYNDVIVFPENELEDFRSYTSECLQPMFSESSLDFSQGTLFFIELGEVKQYYPGLEDVVDKLLDNNLKFSLEGDVDLIDPNGLVIASAGMILSEYNIAIDPMDSDSKIVFESAGYRTINSKEFEISMLKLQ